MAKIDRIVANSGQITLYKTFVIVFLLLSLLYLNLIQSSLLNIFTQFCQIVGVLTVLTYLSWLLATTLRKYSQLELISPKGRAVLITGCDTGFGHQLCYKLDSYGFHVFAGLLSTDSQSAEKLRQSCSNKLRLLKLDVTQVEDVVNAVKQIEESGLQLWALVNNAGIAQYALTEMGSDTEVFERVFAVNVFGLVRMTKHCLPLLRKSKGRVVNMASVAGRFTFWGITGYCMSKFAVRAFSDGLRRELKSFGVKVVTIEPNMYKTDIVNAQIICDSIDKLVLNTDPSVIQDYGGDDFAEKLKERLRVNVQISRPQIHEVVDTQEQAITACEPDLYYRCASWTEKPALWFLTIMPESIQDIILTGRTWKTVLKFYKCQN